MAVAVQVVRVQTTADKRTERERERDQRQQKHIFVLLLFLEKKQLLSAEDAAKTEGTPLSLCRQCWGWGWGQGPFCKPNLTEPASKTVECRHSDYDNVPLGETPRVSHLRWSWKT